MVESLRFRVLKMRLLGFSAARPLELRVLVVDS